MAAKKMVVVAARVNEELHKECGKKLIDDNKTFADFVRMAIKRYVSGELEFRD